MLCVRTVYFGYFFKYSQITLRKRGSSNITMNTIIEIFGMPGAGKTTQRSLLVGRLSGKYDIKIFGDRDIPFYEGETFYQFNVRFLNTLERFMEENDVGSGRLLIMDRGYHDSHVWPQVHKTMGNMTEQEVHDFYRMLDQSRQIPLEQSVLFMVDPRITFERGRKVRHPADETVLTPAYLDALYFSYSDYARKSEGRLTVIDGTKPIEVVQEELFSYLSL